MRSFRIPVEQAHLRRIDDPNEPENRYTIHALVRAVDLPGDLPMDVNPRKQNLKSKVVREIARTLDVQPEDFHLLNRGITILCDDAHLDPRSKSLVMQFPDSSAANGTAQSEQVDHGDDSYDIATYVGDRDFGIVDGGHTYQLLLQEVQRAKSDGLEELRQMESAFVRLEVIVGVEDVLALQLARARNTSAQVKDFALANLAGKFEWIKTLVATTPWVGKVAYTENEGSKTDPKPIDIRDIIRIASAFHPEWTAETRIPMHSYTSPGKALEIFSAEEDNLRGRNDEVQSIVTGFRSLRPILIDILQLYWEVKGTFEDVYREIGGETGVKRSKETGEELEVASGRGRGRAGRYEHFTAKGARDYVGGYEPTWLPPEAFVMPIVAAFRSVTMLEQDTGELHWKVDPLDLFVKNRKAYVASIISSATELKKPNAVGKSQNVWRHLYLMVFVDATKAGSK